MTLNIFFKRSSFAVCLLLFFSACQDDVDSLDLETVTETTNSLSTITTVSASEIPEIMDHLRSSLGDRLAVSIHTPTDDPHGQNRNTEPDLVIGEIQTEEIKIATNNFGKSNYTFTLTRIEQPDPDKYSVFNYVIKETRVGIYGLIVEYRMDKTWLRQSVIDYRTFTGEIIVYDEAGVYIGKIAKIDGETVSDDYRNTDPCPPNDNTSGGGGSTSGDGGSTGGTTSGTGGEGNSNDGNGGFNIDVDIICGCDPAHHGGSESDSCHCTDPDMIVVTIRNAETQDTKPFSNRCADIPDCAGENDCQFGMDEFCGCLPEPVENDDIPINIPPDFFDDPCVKLNALFTDTDFTDALQDIRDGAGGSSERGYDVSKDPNTGDITVNFVPGGFDSTPLNTGGKHYRRYAQSY